MQIVPTPIVHVFWNITFVNKWNTTIRTWTWVQITSFNRFLIRTPCCVIFEETLHTMKCWSWICAFPDTWSPPITACSVACWPVSPVRPVSIHWNVNMIVSWKQRSNYVIRSEFLLFNSYRILLDFNHNGGTLLQP